MDISSWWHRAHRSRPVAAPARLAVPTDLPRLEACRAEQMRLLYANAPAGFVATGLNAGLLALTQWPVIPPPVILAWLTYMLMLTGLRAVVVWRFQRVAPAPQAMGPWSTLFTLGTGLAGLGWGGAGVVLFPSTSLPHQVFLTFVVGGMIAGAVGLLAARMGVFLSFACPAAVPLIVHWLAQGDRLATTMGGMAALFTVVSIVTAGKLHHLILASVQLRFDNLDLVASVTAEKERTEHLNTHLTAEIAERQRAEEQLRQSHTRLRALTARLESLREAERIRIAREMHDELSQKLTSLKMDLRWTEHKLGALASSPTITTLLDRVVGATELVDSVIGSVQDIATDLRPGVLDQLGLGMALHYEARRFQERTAIPSEVCLPASELSLAPDLATALFRIFQECLSNVARHAGATQVTAALTVDHGWVTLCVQDNGRGMTAAEMADPRALGLLGMKERAALLGGEVLFARGPKHGTIVTARMPLQTQEPRMVEK
jgi:signal transduction histidine kinase